MATEGTFDNWQHALSASYEQLINQLVTHTPQLLGAALMLFVGWIVAWLLSKLTISLFKLCNRALAGLSQRVQTEQTLQLNLKIRSVCLVFHPFCQVHFSPCDVPIPQ